MLPMCTTDSKTCETNCSCKSVKIRVIQYCATRSRCCIFPSFQDISRSIAILDILLALGIASAELVLAALPNTYIQIYNEYNMKGEVFTEQYTHQPQMFLAVVIIGMFLLIFEGWLFDILIKGSIERDRKKLNQWLNIRVIFLGINVVVTLYRIMDTQFCLYDLIYLPVSMYRILEIVLIKGLMTEMSSELPKVIV